MNNERALRRSARYVMLLPAQNQDGEWTDSRFCPYCGKRKRGWRAGDPDALCAECEQKVRQ